MNPPSLVMADLSLFDRLQGLRNGFNAREMVVADMRTFLLFMVAAALLVVWVVMWSRKQQRAVNNPKRAYPLRLFRAGLKELGIGPFDRLILSIAARRCGIPQPAAMLLSSELLEKSVGKWADGLSPRLFSIIVREKVDRIREAAFPGNAGESN